MQLDLSSVTKVIHAISGCQERAMAAAGIARKSEVPGLTAKDATRVIEVLEGLPYVEVVRSPSGRIAGLRFKPHQAGSCSIWYIRRSPGETRYCNELRCIAVLSDDDDPHVLERHRAARAELEHIAKANGWPLLDNLKRDYFAQIAPVVLQRLQGALAAEASGQEVSS